MCREKLKVRGDMQMSIMKRSGKIIYKTYAAFYWGCEKFPKVNEF